MQLKILIILALVKNKKSFNDFSDFVKLFSDKSQSEKPSEIVKDLIDELKLKDYYQNQKTPDSLDRWRNIKFCF